jgi:hypothetical protein
MNFGTFTGPGYGPVPQSGFKRQIGFYKSTTWIVPMTGYYMVHCIGSGGSGFMGAADGSIWSVSGGGAGGCAIKNRVLLNQGTRLTITIGAGGSSGGSAGGNTTISGGPLNLFGGGGGAGSSGGTNALVAGGTGGSASGGDLNWTGGAGGSAQTAAIGLGQYSLGGGGGVSLWGANTRGGNAVCNTNSANTTSKAMGGGGGSGGRGGDATASSGAVSPIGTGGHAIADGTDATSSSATSGFTSSNTVIPFTGVYGLGLILADPTLAMGIGTDGGSGDQPVAGGGSGGRYDSTSGSPYAFGGSGAGYAATAGGSGTPGIGGGSGGVLRENFVSNSGTGGRGAVFITWTHL